MSVPTKMKKKIPRSTKEMSKEMLQETLRKKREGNARAFKIVEKMCEDSVSENWFLENLEHINQCHFEDVITERSISKICGYPLCLNVLENVPKQKYHISVKSKKVFDITERKNFCSSKCYQSGMYIKEQLLTSPLWFRDQEVIPTFKLLDCPDTSGKGTEVISLKKLDVEATNPEEFRDEVEVVEGEEEDKIEVENLEEPTEDQETLFENEDLNVLMSNLDINQFPEECIVEKNDISSKNNINTAEQKAKPPIESTASAIDNPSISSETIPAMAQYVRRVEESISQWFTAGTLLYLYGEEKVKDLMKDRKEDLKRILSLKTSAPNSNEKMDNLMKLFSILEMKFDDGSISKTLKPLPDYSMLKEDAKNLDIKVKAFYGGKFEQPLMAPEQGAPTEVDAQNDNLVLPLIDTYAQNALRRKIVMGQLNRIIPELLLTLGIETDFPISEVHSLIKHCSLDADNITFKPGETYLLGLVLLKLLSLKNSNLKNLLCSQKCKKHLTLFLMSYELESDYLDNIVEWLTNCDMLIEKLN